ncbi:MAG: sulfite oxidase-like oxidoreductase [Candidatus Caldarchaeum sp.]|uniref:Sulfite oxidase-like oxidoreductase n=1 Tax=Caldiarchaeum subterraneum TaxID=311458 RepID=A0A7C4E2Y2_CALS0
MDEILPPGQVWARNWVIYSALGTPRIDVESYRLRVTGLVEEPREYSYQELLEMADVEYVKPFHCVTKWSIRDVRWTGVSLKRLLENSRVKREGKWLMFVCADGYTAPVPLEDALSDDAIVALKMDGRPLEVDQGFPARPFIPHLYGWKSAKWLVKMEVLPTYVDGYWEMYGYHERGNVWGEERFKGMGFRHALRKAAGIIQRGI